MNRHDKALFDAVSDQNLQMGMRHQRMQGHINNMDNRLRYLEALLKENHIPFRPRDFAGYDGMLHRKGGV